MEKVKKEKVFTSYQVFLIAILTILQFTVILDFMVLSPLGAMLMEKLNVSTSQFGVVVSVYAFSAGASGILAAGFADKFDRKSIDVLLHRIYPGYRIVRPGTQFSSFINCENHNRYFRRGYWFY